MTTLDTAAAQRARCVAARQLLEAPVLGTALLDGVRARWDDVDAWAGALDRYDALSGGEQRVFGWLAANTWPNRPGMASSWSLWHAAERCMGDAESARAIRECAETLTALALVGCSLGAAS